MTNLQRVGGKVEVAKEQYFKSNTWTNLLTEKAKLDAFCEWCDRECKVAYYEIHIIPPSNIQSILKYRLFSSVLYALGGIIDNMDFLENATTQLEVRNTLNRNKPYSYSWLNDFNEKYTITIVPVYE